MILFCLILNIFYNILSSTYITFSSRNFFALIIKQLNAAAYKFTKCKCFLTKVIKKLLTNYFVN